MSTLRTFVFARRRQVEEASITPGVNEDTVIGLPEGVAQELGEEDVEEGWGKNTPLFHSFIDWEWFRTGSVKVNGPAHVIVEGHNRAQKLESPSTHLKKGELSISADQVRSLGQVDECQAQELSLLSTLLLQLS